MVTDSPHQSSNWSICLNLSLASPLSSKLELVMGFPFSSSSHLDHEFRVALLLVKNINQFNIVGRKVERGTRICTTFVVLGVTGGSY